ncbi:MAG: hypothetical protein OJF52_001982 [Nitrospira sp.]|nr:MAG: hypothetical protein OJF52_001982 [Nitrospira sp.]
MSLSRWFKSAGWHEIARGILAQRIPTARSMGKDLTTANSRRVTGRD